MPLEVEVPVREGVVSSGGGLQILVEPACLPNFGWLFNEKVNEKVNERQKLIISAIFENPYITQTELAKTLGISVVHVNKNMKKLQEQGIIRRVGPDKGGHWEVIEQNKKGEE